MSQMTEPPAFVGAADRWMGDRAPFLQKYFGKFAHVTCHSHSDLLFITADCALLVDSAATVVSAVCL